MKVHNYLFICQLNNLVKFGPERKTFSHDSCQCSACVCVFPQFTEVRFYGCRSLDDPYVSV